MEKGEGGISHVPQCRARVMKAMKESKGPKHNELVSRHEAKMNSALGAILNRDMPKEDGHRDVVSPPMAQSSDVPSASGLHGTCGETSVVTKPMSRKERDARAREVGIEIRYGPGEESENTENEQYDDRSHEDDAEMAVGGGDNDRRGEPNGMGVDYANDETFRNMEVCLLISQVGGGGKRYQREKQQGMTMCIGDVQSTKSD